MPNKDLQNRRMKQYFLDAAIETVRGEGLKAVSARNIASQAGYSYATLYNYFSDLNELIFECVLFFREELDSAVSAMADKGETWQEKIRNGVTAWVNYFVQYPGIFELFFLERMGSIGNRKDIAKTIFQSIEPACRPALALLRSVKGLGEETAEAVTDSIRYVVAGMMLFYVNRREPDDYSLLIRKLEQQLALTEEIL